MTDRPQTSSEKNGMTIHPPVAQRQLETRHLECDLAGIGGDLAGVCAAITGVWGHGFGVTI